MPSVGVHTDAFVRLVDSVSRANGMPSARRAFVPRPVVGRSSAELRAQIEGEDPISGRPFLTEIVEALTRPPVSDGRSGDLTRVSPRLVPAASEESLHALFAANGWTDHMPITLPTEKRVETMLTGTSLPPDEIVGELTHAPFRERWSFTTEKVAVNAVMAGAKPEYLPVILALATSGTSARISSTSSMSAMVVVNGPIRNEIGMNSGMGAMGPYNHANASIGRAYGLLSQNLQGGSVPGVTYMGSMGNSGAYASVTFAENEERSPWAPLHVQQGFGPEESTVSIFSGWGFIRTPDVRETWPARMRMLMGALDPISAPCLVLDPQAAREFVNRGGFESKEQLAAWMEENVLVTAARYRDNYTWRQHLVHGARAGVEPYASYLDVPDDELVPMFNASTIKIAVTGGETRGQWGFADSRFDKTVPVDRWR